MAFRALTRGFCRARVLCRGFASPALEEHSLQERLRDNLRLHPHDLSLLAASHSHLARHYRELNKPVLTLKHTQEQFALLQQVYPEPTQELAELSKALVELLYQAQQYEQSEAVAQQCLVFTQQAYPASSAEVARAHFMKARINELRGDFTSAAQHCLTAAEILRPLPDVDLLAAVYQTLANIKKTQQQLEEAQTYIATSLALLEESKSESKAEIQASAWSVQGEILCLVGKFAEAETFHKKALENRRNAKSDLEVSTCLSNLGMLYLTVGRLNEAEQLFKEKLDLDQRTVTETHPSTANSHHNLAAVSEAKGDLDTAKTHAQKALSIRVRTLGDRHPHVALSHQSLVSLCLGLRQLDEAEQHARLAADLGALTYAPAHPFLGTALFDLGVVHTLRNKHAEARQYFEQTLQIRKATYSANNHLLGTTYLALAQTCKQLKDLETAADCYDKGYEIMRQLLPGDHPDLGTILNNRGSVHFARQKLTEAEADLRASLEVRKKLGQASGITTRCNLAAVLLKAKKFAAAETELRQCLQVLEKQPQAEVASKEVAQLLVAALKAQNKTKEATALAKRLGLPS